MTQTIDFTRRTVERLRRDYQTALDTGADSFEFEGHLLLTDYAKYLLEYLDLEFKRIETDSNTF